MKKIIKDFFKSKFNISMVVAQCLALIFLCLNSVWQVATILFFVFEGVFFVLWGISFFKRNKKLDQQTEILEKIDIVEIDMDKTQKKNKITKRSNVFTGIMIIMMGFVLIFIAIF